MKFFKENLHLISRLFINQLGITMFSIVLMMASSKNSTVSLCFSIFSTLFYLYLIYTVMWEVGAKDALRIEQGRMEKNPAFPWKASFFASIPNFFIALLMLVGFLFGYAFTSFDAARTLYVVMRLVVGLFEGMYVGIFSSLVSLLPNTDLVYAASGTVFYALSPLLMMGVSALAYSLGIRNNYFLIPKQMPKKKG
jgi:hypothetical protein